VKSKSKGQVLSENFLMGLGKPAPNCRWIPKIDDFIIDLDLNSTFVRFAFDSGYSIYFYLRNFEITYWQFLQLVEVSNLLR
jgi:hypothetical protein